MANYARLSRRLPVVFLRYDELLFDTENVIRGLCRRAFGQSIDKSWDFDYCEKPAKGYAKGYDNSRGRADAMKYYGNEKNKCEGYSKEDIEFLNEAILPSLLSRFGYIQKSCE